MESLSNSKDTLVRTLEQIESIDREVDSLESQIEELKKRRRSLESIALEEMSAARMERGVPAGCRTWRVEWKHEMSLPKDRQREVMEALKREGALDDLLTVNTTTFKSFLSDRHKAAGKDARLPFSVGTPFEGLVSEHVHPVLRHTTVPSRKADEATEAAF